MAAKDQRAKMHHHTKFHKNQPNSFEDNLIFPLSRWPPSATLDFHIFKFLVADRLGRTNIHRHTKFRKKWSTRYRDITFKLFQMEAVYHLLACSAYLPKWLYSLPMFFPYFLFSPLGKIAERATYF